MVVKTPKGLVGAFNKYGSLKAVARRENMTWWAVRKLYSEAVEKGLMEPVRVGGKRRADTKKSNQSRHEKLNIPNATDAGPMTDVPAGTPVLSIKQPWAWAIIHAGKDIENRSRNTALRGRFLIHASKKVDQEGVEALQQAGYDVPDDLPTGGVVGEAKLVDVVGDSDSDWFEGPVGYVLESAKERPFFPMRGQLGFFKYNAEDAPPPEPVVEGRVKAIPTPDLDLPPKGEVRRYLFTCAQNNTRIHQPLWENLHALAEHLDAKIHVARFTYVKTGLGASGDKARVTNKHTLYGGTDLWWEADLVPFFSDDRLEVAPGLVWCGEMNILPTAANPLSGLEVYTGRKSSIFPHVKIALRSVPSGKHEATKFVYTTGTVTMRNYIQRKAGLKAEFHHCYGALLVEVDHEGDWFCRQVNADSTGTIYDLDVKVSGGKVTTRHRVDSIYWGDPHVIEIDETAVKLAFGKNGIKDTLRPAADFMGDVISFKARSHHELRDPHTQFLRHVQGIDDVTTEIKLAGDFFRKVFRNWCDTYAVNGNHERHLGRWLKEQDGHKDPINAEFWLAAQTLVYKHIREGGVEPNFLELAFEVVDPEVLELRLAIFLDEDESVIRCPDAQGGIECGSHGDRGARGARGTARGFAKMGRKRNIGDKHAAAIEDGVYVAGTFESLDADWTRGASDWSHSHIITYENGKRAIVTCWNGKWRA